MKNRNILRVMALVLPLLNVSAQDEPDIVFFGEPSDNQKLYAINIRDGITKEIYQTTTEFVFYEFKQSPKGNLVALLERNGAHMRKGDLGYALQNLVILDAEGKVIRKINDVLKYAWSPTGDAIAFVRGHDYGGHELKPTGIWVSGINSTFPEMKISEERAYDISWALHSGKIYIKWKDVYEVDPVKKTSNKTNLKAIYFSPDGKYYYKPNYEGEGFSLYETNSNKDVTPEKINKANINFSRWLEGEEIILGEINSEEKKIIKVQSGSIIKVVRGEFLGYAPTSKRLVTRSQGKISTLIIEK